MRKMKLKCVRNESKCLPYTVGETYSATNEGKGIIKIEDNRGGWMQAPLNGYYLEFEEVK